ncbi:MAG: SDR family NAD(P)-dependent oxidoreductase, partial [Bacteroidota bacterium]
MQRILAAKTAIITGGSGVLGGAIAAHLAKCGCNVAILGRSLHKVEAQLKALAGMSKQVFGAPCDVTSEEDLKRFGTQVMDRFGSIDILVNGAGGNAAAATQQPGQQIFDLSLDAIKDVVDLNL